ncbi:lipase 1 [Drosophila novamexicana]|uniref:lipase 1 n=1 Tax=Drosophila novamexicana TaxID=47314 RepID=UPI0011E5A1D6|nr:lipase 1 [Drosophila novamexicana]
MPHASCRWSYLLGLLWLSQLWAAGGAGYLEDNYPATVIEDAHLTTLQLLAKYKYPGEAHSVTTEDKYILQMHRIARPGAKPVLLVHGLQDSSATWIMMGPHSGLGYFLYEEGYDVWMGNVRGNRYSRGHVKLNYNTDKSYWTFSWHEIGMYDLPAMIDKVLAKTGYQKLSYFGHSQGTTTFFVMTSSRPEYNAKVHIMQALAPVAFMTHVKGPLLGLGRNLLKVLGERAEVTPHSKLVLDNCMLSAATVQTCMYYVWKIIGKNTAELNKTMLPVMFGHVPAGANSKQFLHYLQLQLSDRFCTYDYNAKENQRTYGRATPVDYALERITAPIALYYTQNDYLSAVEDVKRLIKRLPNVVEDHMYPNKKWNHMDMVWGISARRLAHPRMLEVMRLWEAGGPQNGTQSTTEYNEGNSTTAETVQEVEDAMEDTEDEMEDATEHETR